MFIGSIGVPLFARYFDKEPNKTFDDECPMSACRMNSYEAPQMKTQPFDFY